MLVVDLHQAVVGIFQSVSVLVVDLDLLQSVVDLLQSVIDNILQSVVLSVGRRSTPVGCVGYRFIPVDCKFTTVGCSLY